ncbi:MAG: hypothetical protein KDB22_12490 [Planctomycetales bacterium]|nr:hypothetical protein [Planctomycetales bacterium]
MVVRLIGRPTKIVLFLITAMVPLCATGQSLNLNDESDRRSHELAFADSLLTIGNYREAATAYARMSLKYGATNQLLGRRFIAQVLSGDVLQADVIAQAARLSDTPIERIDLPGGTLDGLGISYELGVARANALAAVAMRGDGSVVCLEAVAVWLTLLGDDERAARFSMFARQADKWQADKREADKREADRLVPIEEIPLPGLLPVISQPNAAPTHEVLPVPQPIEPESLH